MTHCYNVCIFFVVVSRTPISLLAGSFWEALLLVLYCSFFYLGCFPFTWITFLLLRLAYKEGIESITS